MVHFKYCKKENSLVLHGAAHAPSGATLNPQRIPCNNRHCYFHPDP